MVINLNSTILIQMIGFLTLLFILNSILYKPILRVVRQRKETIDSLLNEANTLKIKVLENDNLYASRLEESEKTAKKEYNETVDSATKEKESIITKEMEIARESMKAEKEKIFSVLDKEYNKIEKYKEEISSKIYEQLVG